MAGRKAMTLIELTVTLAIASIVMAAAMAALARAGRSLEAPPCDEAPAALQALLRRDLMHAERHRPTESGFELQAQAMLEPTTMDWQHMPATLAYEVRIVGDRPWLVRTQRPRGRDGRGSQELVCPDVTAVKLKLPGRQEDQNVRDWRGMQASATVLVDKPDGQIELPFLMK